MRARDGSSIGLIAGTLLLVAAARPAQSLEVEHVLWGLDGQVLEQRFNPLSVLLSNPSPEPFDGRVRLQRLLGPGHLVDAPLEEDVYLDPHGRRWVQLYPYVIRDSDQWRLSWGPSQAGSLSLPPPRIGRPAIVLLDDADPLARSGGGMKRLADNLFPPMVTATDGLGAVFLDHVPRWEEARRQAFLDWIRRGGSVHLLKGTDGQFPVLPAPLTDLNGPLERRRIGAGTVTRHDRTRSELTPEFVVSAVRPENPALFPPETGSKANRDDFNPLRSDYHSAEHILLALRKMTRSKHSWAVIGLLSMVYVLMIFPGCKLIGQKWQDYRATHALLLGTIALFSVAFAIVGRRGYGETTAVHSVAVARPLGENSCDVSQWSNVFVTTGDDYRIVHAGRGSLYSACSDHEPVGGIVRNGLAGEFLADIPPFSSRGFAHRTRLDVPVPTARIEAFRASEALEALVIAPGKDFPEQVGQVYALYRDRFYSLREESGRLTMAVNVGSVPGFLRPEDFRVDPFAMNPYYDDETPNERRFENLLLPLMSHSLGIVKPDDAESFRLPDDRVRLFVYAPMPEPFFATNPAFGNQQGSVLYVLDLFPTDN